MDLVADRLQHPPHLPLAALPDHDPDLGFGVRTPLRPGDHKVDFGCSGLVPCADTLRWQSGRPVIGTPNYG